MKYYPALLFMLSTLAATLFAQQSPAPDIPFDVSSPLTMPPDLYIGEVASIAVNSKHHVFTFSRDSDDGGTPILDGRAARLFEFGSDGKFIREIGRNLYSMAAAHSVRVDKEDDIWLVDNGSDEVTELSPDYKVKLVLGRRDEAVGERSRPKTQRPPDLRPGWFNEPTDVAFDAQGNIFVSDGYVNSRVHKFNKDGDIVKSIGTVQPGSGPGEFNVPHAIAVDNSGFVYVADRNNHRIEVLDNDLNYMREIKFEVPIPPNYLAVSPIILTRSDSGWPSAMCISPGRTQYIYVNSIVPNRIYKFTLDGKLVGQIGSPGFKLGQLAWVHGIACVSENEIWAGELLTWRASRFILHPAKIGDETAAK